MTALSNRIAIIDDHDQFRQALVDLIPARTRFSVALQAANGEEFIAKLEQLPIENHPSIVMTDISMPVADGFAVATWLQKNAPGIKLIVLTLTDTERAVIRMITLGIAAFLHKTIETKQLFEALDTVASKGAYYNQYLPGDQLNLDKKSAKQVWDNLCVSDQQLARLLCTDLNEREIASMLSMTPAGYDAKCIGLFAQLAVESRVALALMLFKYHLIR